MAGPTINIKILADASAATSSLDKASGKVSKFGGVMKALPAAAAGAALLSMGKSAVEDAAGQAKLAKQLSNATGATKDQSAAVEDWITKTASASGVADDQLRPALGTLARATGDVGKAQGALGQALDISAATGKPVADVAAAMAKGFSGNTGALGKLVPGLDKGVLATKDMTKISGELARLTGGASADAAKTAEGQFKRLKNSVDETQESIGGALLPVMDKLAPMLLQVANFLQKNADVVAPLVLILGGLAIVLWAVNAAMAANPVTLVVLAIAALVVVLVVAYKKCGTFRAIVQAAFKAIAGVAVWLWNNVLKPYFTLIIGYVKLLWTAFRTAASIVVRAVKGIADIAGWLWRAVIQPVIKSIVAYFKWWWQTAVAAKDKVVATFKTLWTKAVEVKDKVVGAFKTLGEKITNNAIVDAVRDLIGWFDKLFDKIADFVVPKWLTSFLGKVAGAVGIDIGPTYAPAPTARGRTGAARTGAATPAVAASGAGATMQRLTGAGTQVIVQVSDRRMVDLVNVQLRDAAMASKRDLTRRQVVIV